MFIEITRVATKSKQLLNTDKILRVSAAKTGSGHTEIIMSDGLKVYALETYEEVRAMLIVEPLVLNSDVVPKTVLEEIRENSNNAILDSEPWWHNREMLKKVNNAIFGEEEPVGGLDPAQINQWEYTVREIAKANKEETSIPMSIPGQN